MDRSVLALGVAVLALLVVGCGEDAESAAGAEAAAGPCPAALTAGQLTDATELGSGDVDGDGSVDDVAIGAVPGGEADCAVAVVATTAETTYAAPVAGPTEAVGEQSLAEPTFAQIDGLGGDEVVVTTSWNPRGGGGLSMFSFVDGGLVQVTHSGTRSGEPWTVFGTVDDGGGSPQPLGCADGGIFVHATTPDPRATVSEISVYALREGQVTKLESIEARGVVPETLYVRDTYPGMPTSGLAVFDDCG